MAPTSARRWWQSPVPVLVACAAAGGLLLLALGAGASDDSGQADAAPAVTQDTTEVTQDPAEADIPSADEYLTLGDTYSSTSWCFTSQAYVEFQVRTVESEWETVDWHATSTSAGSCDQEYPYGAESAWVPEAPGMYLVRWYLPESDEYPTDTSTPTTVWVSG